MLINLLNLLIGFSLIIIAFAILLNYFKVYKINFFFFLLILIAGIARFQFGLVSLGFLYESKPLIFRVFIALFIFPPLYFLCLKSFISEKSSLKGIFAHFIFFLFIILCRLYFGEIDLKIVGVLFFLYSAFYYYLLTRSSLTYLRTNLSTVNSNYSK